MKTLTRLQWAGEEYIPEELADEVHGLEMAVDDLKEIHTQK